VIARVGLAADPAIAIPDDARIGAHVVLEAGVVLGAGVTIQHHAVIGKQPALAARSRTRPAYDGEADARTLLADGCTVGCGAVLVAGVSVGPRAIVGDHTFLREGATLGADVVLGHGGAVGPRVEIGARTRIQNSVMLGPGSVVEDDVFVGPGVIVTNDPTLGRREAGRSLTGATLRRGCRVGAAVVLMPGVEIGAEAVVAAGSLVTRDVAPGMLVMGIPARVVRTASAAPGPA